MKSGIALVLFLSLGLSASGQKKLPKFGNISMEEMKMTTFEPDTSAAAVILFEKGETNLISLNTRYKRHVRIKVLSKEGFRWADGFILVGHSGQGITDLKATTYNLVNGKIVESEMEKSSVFRSRFNRYLDQLKFTMPNVMEGSVIEYSYSIQAGGVSIPAWQFQYSIPCLYSDYEVWSTKYVTFSKDMQGYLPLTAHDERAGGEYEHFIMADIPAFKPEPFITTPDDYLSKVRFHVSQLIIPGQPTVTFDKSWEEIVKEVYKNDQFGGQIKGSGFLQSTVDQLTAGMTEPRKKLQVIYDYVKANVAWDDTKDLIPDHSFKKVLEDKKGSSGEINLLLLTMLNKAGLVATPVFISTRDHGMVRPFVRYPGQFNDVICLVRIEDKPMLVDATDKDIPISVLPQRCLNGKGLVLSEHEEWIDITSPRSREVISVELKVAESGELNGLLSINRDGIVGGTMRKSYRDLGEEKYIKNLQAGKVWEITKSEFSNMTNPMESVREKHEVVIRDHAQSAGSVIYLNPFIMERLEQNQFKSETREYPVDFASPFEKLYISKIILPDGYEVEELPKSKLSVLPGNTGKYAFTVSQNGNIITVMSQLVISKGVYTSEEYPYLRQFYDQIVAKQGEQIVLKKK